MDEWSPPENMPRHVAIVMDGNGRWAKQKGLPRAMGHRKGMEAMREIVRESSDLGLTALTVYAFSTENWRRARDEVGVLMRLLLEFYASEIDEMHSKGVRILMLGDMNGLPGPQRTAIEKSMRLTQNNTGLRLNVAFNYGGRDELVRAARRIAREAAQGLIAPEAIDEAAFADRLDTAGLPEVDLVIRTSGEQRMSNFLPYQAAYAELMFPDTLWPDFTIDAYHEALDAYAKRQRRFGGRTDEGA